MHSVWLNLLTGENHVMLWHSIVQELWKRSPKMTSKEQQQISSALLKKSRQGTQKANPLCLNKSVIIFVCQCCLHQLIHVTLNVLLCSCWAFWVLFEYCPCSFMIIICSDLIKILNYQSYTHGKKNMYLAAIL